MEEGEHDVLHCEGREGREGIMNYNELHNHTTYIINNIMYCCGCFFIPSKSVHQTITIQALARNPHPEQLHPNIAVRISGD